VLPTQVQIPPRVFQDECVACRITRAGSVLGFRNHAHRLARDIWSDPFDLRGEAQPSIGRLSAQEPQVIRMLPAPRALSAGQVVELHCQYDARQADRPTFLGLDERSREMCNQYYISTAALRFSCDSERAAVASAPTAALAAAAADYARSATGVPVGQVTAVAADGQSVFFFHRGPADFTNTQPLEFDPIVRYSRRSGSFSGAFGRGLFTVPHGLSVDHDGMLWATDVATHQVWKLDPRAGGKMMLKLGDGRASSGRSSFNKPTDVAVDRTSGDIYVADGYGNSRIVVFSSTGAYLREWGSAGAGKGQFRVPHGIAIDSRKLVYVADRENSRVQVMRRPNAPPQRCRARPPPCPLTLHMDPLCCDLAALSSGSV
jgi:peptidylamidoglycolate lyase